jgi:hypothetical protein
MGPSTKTYIGDSVYADFDGVVLTLTTENGCPDDPSNTIVLESEVLKALIEYARRVGFDV